MKVLMGSNRYGNKSNVCDIRSNPGPEDDQLSLCCLCGQTFPSIKSLHTHINVVHEEVADSFDFHPTDGENDDPAPIDLRCHISPPSHSEEFTSQSDSAIPCPNCRKSFSDVTSLRAHIDAVHQDNRTGRCDICGKTFTTLSYLRMHITTVHEGVRAYTCDLCQKSYTQKHSLKKHLMNAHAIVMTKEGIIEDSGSNNNHNNNGAIYKSTQSGYPDDTRAPKSRKKLLVDSSFTPESSSPSPSGINNVESPASSEPKAHCNL
ncbi:unnamed protein product [Trichobilharzia szidati]|nr:unnamed protein product [Trichobilharzia szidati]